MFYKIKSMIGTIAPLIPTRLLKFAAAAVSDVLLLRSSSWFCLPQCWSLQRHM